MASVRANLFYYVNARLGGRTSLLAGPFVDIEKANEMLPPSRMMFAKMNPEEAAQATFGIMSCKSTSGYGIFNLALVEAGAIGVTLPPAEEMEKSFRSRLN